MKTKSKKQPTVKARRMWAYPRQMKSGGSAYIASAKHNDSQDVPLFIIPADADSYERLVAQAAEGIAIRHGHPWGGCGDSVKHVFRDDSKAALAALGITRPTQ